MIKLKPKTSTVISAVAVLVLILLPLVSFAQTDTSAGWFQKLLYTYVNVVFGWLVWATGNLLDYAVGEYVVGFGRNFVETGLGSSINNLWVVIRDVFNLTFIFGLVFIGFKMILNNDSDTKRKLVYLILAALLVNFSLFITKFVIDFTNIAATQIAETFTQIEGTGQTPSDTPLGTTNKYNVAGAFLQIMGLTSLWSSITGGDGTVPVGGDAGWAYIIGTFILLLVCAFVFAAGAFLLIIRFVVLNIYMVLSPVMFLGWVFPSFSGASSKFWSGFLNRAFFAPAYLLMLYIALYILQGIDSGMLTGTQSAMSGAFSGANNAAAAEAARTSFLATFPTFILACTFMIAAIVVAQKMGAVGANKAIAAGKSYRGYVQRKFIGGHIGLTGAILRNTAGAASNSLLQNDRVNRAAQGRGWRAWGARRIQDGANAAATSSFDVRNIKGFGKAVEIGDGSGKGGFQKKLDDRAKKEKERARRHAYNDQAYDDYGVRAEFDEYQGLVRRREETFQRMASSRNQTERQMILDEIRAMDADIQAMENGSLTHNDQYLDADQQAGRRTRLEQFRNARAAANANYGQRLYAANLATRYDNLPIINTNNNNLPPALVGFLTRNQERTNASEEITREAGRNPQERLLRDFIERQNQAQNNPPTS